MLPKSNNDGTRHVQPRNKFSVEIKIPVPPAIRTHGTGTRPRDRIAHIVSSSIVAPRNIRSAIGSPFSSTFPTGELSLLHEFDVECPFRVSLLSFDSPRKKGLGGIGRNLVKSWPRCPRSREGGGYLGRAFANRAFPCAESATIY